MRSNRFKKLKDELTTKMHAEFEVDPETEIKHRVFSLLSLTEGDLSQADRLLNTYNVNIEDVKKYLLEYKELTGE